MLISDWLDYDFVCRHDCSDCIYSEACAYPYHLNHMWVSRLLELTTEDEISAYMKWIESQPLGKIGCIMSCNGQGRHKGSKNGQE